MTEGKGRVRGGDGRGDSRGDGRGDGGNPVAVRAGKAPSIDA